MNEKILGPHICITPYLMMAGLGLQSKFQLEKEQKGSRDGSIDA